MTAIDPHRTLGLTPGASQAEIKRAYRHLAKLYHPDSAGERALPRFLAIQAAYEALVEDPGQRRVGRAGSTYRPPEPPRQPWQADASRARATREAYRARTRRNTSGPPPGQPGSGTGSPPGTGTAGTRAGRAGTGAAADGSAPGGTAGGRGTAGVGGSAGSAGGKGSGTPRSSQSGRSRRSRGPKATIGSTSYDGADKEPFDPAWEGATWYGAGSGTYWTLNPKEYADPRKHGPEYLARSRRSLGGPAADVKPSPGGTPPSGGPPPAEGPTAEADPVDPSPGAASPPDPAAPADGARSGDARPWPPSPAAATSAQPGPGAGPQPSTNARAGRPPSGPNSAGDSLGWRPTAGRPQAAGPERFVESAPSGLLRASMTLPGRIGLAVVGWIPLGVAVSIASNAVPACSDAVSVCSDPLKAGIWPLDLLLIALLVALPRLAVIATYGAGAFLIVGMAATPVLLAIGGAQTPSGTATALGIVLIVAWVGGIALALSGRVELPPWRGPRVGGPRVR